MTRPLLTAITTRAENATRAHHTVDKLFKTLLAAAMAGRGTQTFRNEKEGQEKVDDQFRAIVRVAAVESKSSSVLTYLTSLFEKVSTTDGDDIFVNRTGFESKLRTIKAMNVQLGKRALQSVFDKCDHSASGRVSIQDLASWCETTIASGRSYALKMRAHIIEMYSDNPESGGFKGLYDSYKLPELTYLDKEGFYQMVSYFVGEESLGDSDLMTIHGMFDADGDGKISYDDFLSFVTAEETVRASKALRKSNMDAIVDLKISTSREQDLLYQSQGYQHIPQNPSILTMENRGAGVVQDSINSGTLGRGINFWIWRKKFGTCDGRLKTIVDIQLEAVGSSSAMVLSGYTCQRGVTLSGQYLWVKYATSPEHEDDAITDIRVTVGKNKSENESSLHQPRCELVSCRRQLQQGIFLTR